MFYKMEKNRKILFSEIVGRIKRIPERLIVSEEEKWIAVRVKITQNNTRQEGGFGLSVYKLENVFHNNNNSKS